MTYPGPITYHPHARSRMRRRGITERQVETALGSYHTSFPAPRLPGRPFRSTVYLATVDGRGLKVYVEDDRQPAFVRTVAWEGEDE